MFSTALSGLQAAQLRMTASAHNIANVATAEFRPQQVTTEALPDGGVAAVVSSGEATGTDLVTEIVEQLAAGQAFRANAASLQRAADTVGTLIDTLA